ncbi:alkyl hydroperoxide reductase subunit D [Chitinophaga terrae (ex Kim and Jung 2007)]|uniref:Alkyl hydroperoxide reductase AhpD n=1 Tax=Chitinophaga terrae (ex Kim and Jung 2007) TaxID=408074 RepID=A0A1H3Z796_9BACT|nr:carboxymuconolactone decarboxylase family protein [Chitinophaga terrae (ex Kim and Jung 2007)]GEP88616.1 alkyl hydroperoxide reductase AhpD [Chitinophaga terrae (ex Kim and Jung 2007)]SEA19693.1 alkyl hydroperoxide reductase subunit D [Chitinophaga terrae (ex Kim and Jung 2007)]
MFATTNQDTAVQLLEAVGLTAAEISGKLQALVNVDARYLKDLKINVTNSLAAATLTKKEAYLIGLSVAVNEKNVTLQQSFEKLALQEGANEKEVAEVISCTSLMNANNVYYRFRHFVNKEFYTSTPAGIRMSIMANPVVGKEFFELLSLVVSALNGCEMCVTSHEDALLKHGTEQQRVLDAVRLGAVLRSLVVLL